MERLKAWARELKCDTVAVWLAARDPRVPWYAKAIALAIAAYAFSPIDLIPDFIPVLGYLDDLVLVPLGLWLVVRLVPPEIMAELRAEAERRAHEPRASRIAGAVVVLIWLLAAALVAWLLFGTRAAASPESR